MTEPVVQIINPATGNPLSGAVDEPDLIVLSDLHLGLGKNPRTGRFFSLEAFFYDDDFERFCRFLCADAAARSARFRLVFNGDVFDLLRIDPTEQREKRRFRGPRRSAVQTPVSAARTVTRILAGHPGVVRGLAHVLQHAEAVVFLPGNHDIEIQWPCVQTQIRRVLISQVRAAAGEAAAEAADSRLQFCPWFYHEPGRIWVEHGCQYDPENSFRYFLRTSMEQMPASIHKAEFDVPLGNFIQRYLYNHFGHITFMVPSARANARYFRWLLLNEPRLLAHVVASHAPFVAQVLRRLARYAGPAKKAIRHAHEAELHSQAEKSGLGQRLVAIEGFKEQSAETVQAIKSWFWQFIKTAGTTALLGAACAAVWFASLQAVSEMTVGFGPKALLFLMLNFFMLVGMTLGAGYALLRNPAPVSPRPLRRAAQRIVNTLDVPIVAFGHSHDEEIWPVRRKSIGRGWYFNTGTWIAVFTHDVLIPRERVQFTFLRLRGKIPELFHWSPGRGEPLGVVLLDEPKRRSRAEEAVVETPIG